MGLGCRWCNVLLEVGRKVMMQLEQAIDHFSKNHIKILFGVFNAKLGKELGQ